MSWILLDRQYLVYLPPCILSVLNVKVPFFPLGLCILHSTFHLFCNIYINLFLTLLYDMSALLRKSLFLSVLKYFRPMFSWSPAHGPGPTHLNTNLSHTWVKQGGPRPLREAIPQSLISVGFRLLHSPLCASLCPGQTLWAARSAAQWTPRGPALGGTGDSSAAVPEDFLPLCQQQSEKEIAGEWPLQG